MVTGNRGANIVDLRLRRIERLQGELSPHLEAGHVIVEVSGVDSVDEWRAAARAAARREGWHVRTGVAGDSHVWAVRVDLESSPQNDRAQLMDALNAISGLLTGLGGSSNSSNVLPLPHQMVTSTSVAPTVDGGVQRP